MTPFAPIRQSPHWTLALAGTTLGYALAAWAALWLALSPGYAAPLSPAAGIALVCVLTFGRRMLFGVALGAFVVGSMHAIVDGSPSWRNALFVPLAIAAGAALQAGVGAWLVRRFTRQPFVLSEPRDIAAFFGLGGAVACLIGASVGTAALYFIGGERSQLWFSWAVWASGDALGVLIAGPMVLTLVGRPSAEWAARRLTVGVTMAVVMLLTALGIKQVARWEQTRVQATFERDAVFASANLAAQLEYPLNALEALRGVYLASPEITRGGMHRATLAWLVPGNHLQAMGWTEFVSRVEAPQFEERVRATDFPAYRVSEPGIEGVPAEDVLAVTRFVEPLAGNAAMLGVNARGIPEAREAIDKAVRTDTPMATAGFRSPRDPEGKTSVLIYHALYRGSPATASGRVGSVRGVVFVSLRTDDALRAFRSSLPAYLNVCIVDTDPDERFRRLAGEPGCENVQSELLHVRPLPFAGRQWDVRVSAERIDVPDSRERNALLFSLVGLAAASMLGALLLTVTGRTRRIQEAVAERTEELQREMIERERTAADLRESEQRFRNILNNVPIGVVYTDLHGNVKQVNPRYCELTGYSAEELATMNMTKLVHPDDVPHNLELSSQLVRGEIPMYRRQGRYFTRGGRVVWMQSVVTLLRDTQGKPHRIVGVVEDITEHLRLAEAERAREIAEAANLAKSEFLSRMSHELRTPLNAMLGFAQLLELDQHAPIAPSHKPWVTQIQAAGWHLLDMINDVLDLSRIESGTLNLQSETLDLREILKSAFPLVQQDVQRRGISVSDNIPDEISRVTGDGTRVKQILINLLSNAVKYNNERGKIHVSAHVGMNDCVELIVTDTGLGMSPSQLSQLFQPFNRLGRERSALEGTGIGLVISQRLADLMGGSLRARSTSGEGSSFVLSLPRAERGDTAPGPLTDPGSISSDYHQRCVHYVEDNETNVEVMRGILLRRPQVKFNVSLNGLDGLADIRSSRPDLILLDMHLPDIDGLELLRHLKSDEKTADIPVVVVSADALTDQIDAALKAGASNYLTKPVSVVELLAVVDGVLDKAETYFG